MKLSMVFLTQIGGILKPFAWIFGKVFNLLFELVNAMGIEHGAVAITVVLFTIVTKMLMMPLTIKQQKFSKLSNKMQPELSAIQEKYKGKKDEKSMRLQQMETSAVYERYGTNPTAGCLPLLITLPIMFALYRVIYAIPAYVNKIYELYDTIADGIRTMPDFVTYMTEMAGKMGVSVSKFAETAGGDLSNVHMIDIMTKFGTEQWDALMMQFPTLNIAGTVERINAIHMVGDFNILNKPSNYGFSLALLIPVLAVVTQLLQSFLTRTKTPQNKDNAMAQSMNSMMYIMPFVSGLFCWSFPICVGFYWITSTVVTIIQQFFINRHIDRMDLDEMIQKNVAKQNKRKEKMGIETGSRMAELAKTQTKSINYASTEKKTMASYAKMGSKNGNQESTDTGAGQEELPKVEKKSISGYANMMKKNYEKGDK